MTTPVQNLDRPNLSDASPSSRLPGLSERPDGLIVIYDGNCQFCQKQVQRLNRFDGGQRLAFVSLHDPIVAQRYPHLSYDQMMEQMYVIDQAGNSHGGAAALRLLSRRLPKLWILAPLLHIPFSLPIWQWLYRCVARTRYRWNRDADACEDGTCSIHAKK